MCLPRPGISHRSSWRLSMIVSKLRAKLLCLPQESISERIFSQFPALVQGWGIIPAAWGRTATEISFRNQCLWHSHSPKLFARVLGKVEAILWSYKRLCLPTAPPGKIRLLDGGCWLWKSGCLVRELIIDWRTEFHPIANPTWLVPTVMFSWRYIKNP